MTRMMKIERTYRVHIEEISTQDYYMDIQAESHEEAEEKGQKYLDKLLPRKVLDWKRIDADELTLDGWKIEREIWDVEEIDTSQEK